MGEIDVVLFSPESLEYAIIVTSPTGLAEPVNWFTRQWAGTHVSE